MTYRNKTYVAFASEDIHNYYLMKAWKSNDNIDFNFYDAHDLNTARDHSLPETIKRRLRERIANTKQVVVLLSEEARKKATNGSFFNYEIDTIVDLGLPVVFANLNGKSTPQHNLIPPQFDPDYYTISVPFGPKRIQYALDNYVPSFLNNSLGRKGPHYYE